MIKESLRDFVNVDVSNSGSGCRSHPSGQLCASCATNFRKADQSEAVSREGLGWGRQILLTGQVLNVLQYPMYPGRAPNDDQKRESNGGRKIWLSWLQCHNNLPSYRRRLCTRHKPRKESDSTWGKIY